MKKLDLVQRNPLDGQWKVLTENGVPKASVYAVTSGFIVDENGRFPLLFRGPNVRSAKNAWSLPSGLHDCGLTMFEQLAVEAKEELTISAYPGTGVFITTYENIAQVDSYHWSISLLAIPCFDLSTLTNKEPDKHTDVQYKTVSFIESDLFLQYTWAPGLCEAIARNKDQVVSAIKQATKLAKMLCDT